MEIRELAKLAITYFISKERDSGSNYWTTKDDRPIWLQELIREAHNGMLPDDYKYSYVLDSLYAIAEGLDADSIDVDIYTGDLTLWLSSHIGRVEYVDQALLDVVKEPESLISLLQYGQQIEREEVFYSVYDSLKNEANRYNWLNGIKEVE